MFISRLLCVFLTLPLASSVFSMSARLPQSVPYSAPKPLARITPETLLVKSLFEIQHRQLDSAMNSIEALLKINPNFRLAQLIKGDLLLARAQSISTLGNAADAPVARVDELREEAKMRLQRYQQETPSQRIPQYLLQMQPEQKYAVIVDTSKSRLYLYQNISGEPRYITDYYITIGKNGADKTREGDQKTPLGVYFVTADLSKNRLSDFYGSGAFPISYPNEWDKRQGRNGHGIWLHGTPSDTYSRPPKASNGCVVLPNSDMSELAEMLQIGLTPVIISKDIHWVSRDQWRVERDALATQFENWRNDWESRDAERYLSHYSTYFSNSEQTFDAWASQKRQVNITKSWIKIHLSRVSMFRYPGQENLAVVTFDQDYQSNNLSNQIRKRQYWMLENNRWKIVYEGAV